MNYFSNIIYYNLSSITRLKIRFISLQIQHTETICLKEGPNIPKEREECNTL